MNKTKSNKIGGGQRQQQPHYQQSSAPAHTAPRYSHQHYSPTKPNNNPYINSNKQKYIQMSGSAPKPNSAHDSSNTTTATDSPNSSMTSSPSHAQNINPSMNIPMEQFIQVPAASIQIPLQVQLQAPGAGQMVQQPPTVYYQASQFVPGYANPPPPQITNLNSPPQQPNWSPQPPPPPPPSQTPFDPIALASYLQNMASYLSTGYGSPHSDAGPASGDTTLHPTNPYTQYATTYGYTYQNTEYGQPTGAPVYTGPNPSIITQPGAMVTSATSPLLAIPPIVGSNMALSPTNNNTGQTKWVPYQTDGQPPLLAITPDQQPHVYQNVMVPHNYSRAPPNNNSHRYNNHKAHQRAYYHNEQFSDETARSGYPQNNRFVKNYPVYKKYQNNFKRYNWSAPSAIHNEPQEVVQTGEDRPAKINNNPESTEETNERSKPVNQKPEEVDSASKSWAKVVRKEDEEARDVESGRTSSSSSSSSSDERDNKPEFKLTNGAFPPIGQDHNEETDEQPEVKKKETKKRQTVWTNSKKQQEYLNYQKSQEKEFEPKPDESVESKLEGLNLEGEPSSSSSKRVSTKRHHVPSQPTLFSFIKDKSKFADSDTPEKPAHRRQTTVSVKINTRPINMADYNPRGFNISPSSAKFFVIKSYSEEDVYRSIKFNIWCSTEHGNRRLDEAFEKANQGEQPQPVYLFFSVNGSRHFCGVAEMLSHVDYSRRIDLWSQDKWRGCFQVKWIYVKDIPNAALRNIRLENNEMKSVTHSRDTQEVPYERGLEVLSVFHFFAHSSCILDSAEKFEAAEAAVAND